MRKSKVLSVAMSSVLVASIAAAASVSVSAEITKTADIADHKVGVTGGFNNWAEDVELTDADGDGIYEGVVEVAEVTEDMIKPWSVDDKETGESYLQFKVRLDGEWTDSWGNYEPLHDRCYNSQSNVPVKEAVAGKPISFKVYFDTTGPNPDALKNPKSYAEEGDDAYDYLYVHYEVVESSTGSGDTATTGSDSTSKEEEPSKEEESSKEDTAASTTDTTGTTSTVATETSTDTSTVPTGDATSAAALAAVVIASLGVAVVMTKKASAK